MQLAFLKTKKREGRGPLGRFLDALHNSRSFLSVIFKAIYRYDCLHHDRKEVFDMGRDWTGTRGYKCFKRSVISFCGELPSPHVEKANDGFCEASAPLEDMKSMIIKQSGMKGDSDDVLQSSGTVSSFPS